GTEGVESQPSSLVIPVVAFGAMLCDKLFDGGALKPCLRGRRRLGQLLSPVHADQSAGQEENWDPTAGGTPRTQHEELLRRRRTRQLARIASERKLKGGGSLLLRCPAYTPPNRSSTQVRPEGFRPRSCRPCRRGAPRPGERALMG